MLIRDKISEKNHNANHFCHYGGLHVFTAALFISFVTGRTALRSECCRRFWGIKNYFYICFPNYSCKLPPMKKLLSLSLVVSALLAATQTYPQRIVFAGDSVTDAGWGRSAGYATPVSERNLKDLNHIYGHGYMMLCASYFESRRPEQPYEFFNRGISGDDLARIEARWDNDVLSLDPDVLSLLVGINDTYYHAEQHAGTEFDFEGWECRYRALLDRARAANPQLRIILGTPFIASVGNNGEAGIYPLCERTVHRLAEIVVAIAADYDAVVVRYDEMFARLPGQHPAVAMSHWIWDGIHPTAAGHRLMSDLWIESFSRLESRD